MSSVPAEWLSTLGLMLAVYLQLQIGKAYGVGPGTAPTPAFLSRTRVFHQCLHARSGYFLEFSSFCNRHRVLAPKRAEWKKKKIRRKLENILVGSMPRR